MTARRHGCNIHQIQAGPLHIVAPKLLKLSNGKHSSRFSGLLEIQNKGKSLVTFKVLSAKSSTLKIAPSYGFIESDETAIVKVVTKDYGRGRKHSVVILATACGTYKDYKVIHRLELSSFWRNLTRDAETTSYVEVIKIDNWEFDNVPYIPLTTVISTLYDVVKSSRSKKSHSYSSEMISATESSWSLASEFSDSEEDGYNNLVAATTTSESNFNRRSKYRQILNQMEDETKHLSEIGKTSKSWIIIITFFVIFYVLYFLQQKIMKAEIEISVLLDRK